MENLILSIPSIFHPLQALFYKLSFKIYHHVSKNYYLKINEILYNSIISLLQRYPCILWKMYTLIFKRNFFFQIIYKLIKIYKLT